MPAKSSLGGTLPGHKWRATHQATVNSVLGSDPNSDKYRRVRSQGAHFLNKDTWFARSFASSLCEWARLNKYNMPTEYDIRLWVVHANSRALHQAKDRGIVIAHTPDELAPELAMALVGGAYHEAWHTEYSRRTPLKEEDVLSRTQELWAQIPWAPERGYRGWSKLTEQLLSWSNIIEDIRIERLGCQEYPGSPSKMEALQDLILRMEGHGTSASEHRGLHKENFLGAVQGAFRDLGLGYRTSLQSQALEKYKQQSPKGWALVNSGALRSILDRAISLGRKDDMESLWLAMEVLVVLSKLAAPEAAAKFAAKKAAEDARTKEQEKAREEAEEKAREEAKKRESLHVDQMDATAEETDEIEPDLQEQVVTLVTTEKPPLYKVGDEVELKIPSYLGQKAKVVKASLPDPVTGVQELEFELLEEVAEQDEA